MTSVPVWRCFPLLCVLWITFVETGATAWQPPHIYKQATTSIMFIKRSDVITLPCEASGNPEPNYKWIHNDRDLNMTKYIQQNPGHGTIIITVYGEQQDGYYQCFAINKFGTSVSNIVRMRWAIMDIFRKQVPKTFIIAPGKSKVLFDVPPRSIPNGEVQWFRMSPLGKHDDVTDLFPANEVAVTQEGHLFFRSLSKKHGNVGKPYMCAVTNTVLGITVFGTEFTLQIEGPDDAPKEPLTWMYASPYDVLAFKGDTITLRCIFGGNPIPVIKWKRKTGELPSQHELSEDSSTLTIPNFKESDSTSDYICEASNGGSFPELRHFTFKYEARPYWVLALHPVSLLEGDTETFWCSAYGVPTPTYIWYINGVKLQDVRDPRIYQNPRVSMNPSSRHSNELTIANVTAADNMNIQCNATNRHGYVFSDVYLVIELPREFVCIYSVFYMEDTLAVNSSQTSGADLWTTCCRDLFIMAAFILWCVI